MASWRKRVLDGVKVNAIGALVSRRLLSRPAPRAPEVGVEAEPKEEPSAQPGQEVEHRHPWVVLILIGPIRHVLEAARAGYLAGPSAFP